MAGIVPISRIACQVLRRGAVWLSTRENARFIHPDSGSVQSYVYCERDSRSVNGRLAVRPSTVPSHIALRIEKPAGWSRRLFTTEVQMLSNLLLLLLILVILDFEVKVIVRRR